MSDTESKYTRELMKSLRTHMQDATIFKIADMFTMGVPDICITPFDGVSTWFEAKFIDEYPCLLTENADSALKHILLKPKSHVPAVQWETLRRLRRGYVIVYTPWGHALTYVGVPRDNITVVRLRLFPFANLVEMVIAEARRKEQ